MVELVGFGLFASAVGAPASVSVEDVGAKLPLVECAVLVLFVRDLGVLHELGVEDSSFDADVVYGIERTGSLYPGQGVCEPADQRRR